MNIVIKRVYDKASSDDGWRVLIDRLWPRGLTKEKAHIDDWCKIIAPSNELRHWFNHEIERWPEFQTKYLQELRTNADAVAEFKNSLSGKEKVTLLYSAHDEAHNNAIVLKDFLRQ